MAGALWRALLGRRFAGDLFSRPVRRESWRFVSRTDVPFSAVPVSPRPPPSGQLPGSVTGKTGAVLCRCRLPMSPTDVAYQCGLPMWLADATYQFGPLAQEACATIPMRSGSRLVARRLVGGLEVVQPVGAACVGAARRCNVSVPSAGVPSAGRSASVACRPAGALEFAHEHGNDGGPCGQGQGDRLGAPDQGHDLKRGRCLGRI